MHTKKDGEQVEITISDVQLYVQVQQGDEIQKDCSCDSSFMLETIPEVRVGLQKSFHWFPQDQTIYLVMDNAGGHGTNDAIKTYTDGLKEYNVEIIWQVPRSPETNMLDLGVWMSIHNDVERMHHGIKCSHNALAKSVKDYW